MPPCFTLTTPCPFLVPNEKISVRRVLGEFVGDPAGNVEEKLPNAEYRLLSNKPHDNYL